MSYERTRETIELNKRATKNWWASMSAEERETFRRKLSEAQRARFKAMSPEARSEISRKARAWWTDRDRQEMSERTTRRNYERSAAGTHPFQSKENKELTSGSSHEFWATPGSDVEKEEIKRKIASKVLQHRGKTVPEIELEALLQRVAGNGFKFNDGWFVLGGKVPDFVNVNGKKLLVEMFGSAWHTWDEPNLRCDFFEPYGYQTLVVWDYELGRSDLFSRVEKFVYPNQIERYLQKALRTTRRWLKLL